MKTIKISAVSGNTYEFVALPKWDIKENGMLVFKDLNNKEYIFNWRNIEFIHVT